MLFLQIKSSVNGFNRYENVLEPDSVRIRKFNSLKEIRIFVDELRKIVNVPDRAFIIRKEL